MAAVFKIRTSASEKKQAWADVTDDVKVAAVEKIENSCRKGNNCANSNCRFNHPSDWFLLEENPNSSFEKPFCGDDWKCSQRNCRRLHKSGRRIDAIRKGWLVATKECKFGSACRNKDCTFLHSSSDDK